MASSIKFKDGPIFKLLSEGTKDKKKKNKKRKLK